MGGLPKKYAKMGFKKGWRAYKASKGTGRKRRRSSKKRVVRARRRYRTAAKRAPVRRRRRATTRRRRPVARRRAPARRRRRSIRRIIPRLRVPRVASLKQTAIQLGAGVTGAAVTTVAVRATPFTPTTRAWLQLGLGAAGIGAIRPRRKLWRAAALGSALSGALALAKQAFPGLPLMGGCGRTCMGANWSPGRYRRLPSGVQRTVTAGVGRSPEARRRGYLEMRRGLRSQPLVMGAGLGAVKDFATAPAQPAVMGWGSGKFMTNDDM